MDRRLFLAYMAATAASCAGHRSAFADWPGQGAGNGSNNSGWPGLSGGSVSDGDPPVHTNFRFEGCNLVATARDGNLMRPNFLPTSGFGQRFDQAFHEEFENLQRLSRLGPSCAFFNDRESKNAFASSTDVIHGRSPHGAIGLGVNLLGHFMAMPTVNPSHNAAILEAVFVHEWAHIAQFAYGVHARRIKYTELMADFMAGWYIGYGMARGKQWDVRLGMQGVYSIGDSNFNDPQHHGTPHERLAAYDAGINFVAHALQRRQLPDFMTAFRYAVQDFIR